MSGKSKSSSLQNKKISEKIFIYVMMAFPVISFLVFWLYVNFSSILMAFQQPTYDGSGEYIWTGANFKEFFQDLVSSSSVIRPAIKNTLIFFFANVLIVLPGAVLMCYFLYKKIFMYKVFRFIFFLPSIIMATVLVVLFRFTIEAGGPLFALWEKMGKEPIIFLKDSKYALNVILFYTIFTTFGGNLVLLNGAMKTIDNSIIEAGVLEGVSMPREIFQIIIPLIWPTLSTMIVLASVAIFTSSGPILLFTKGEKGTMTISYWIFSMVSNVNGQIRNEYASAVGLVFTAIGFPIVLIIKKVLNVAIDNVEY